MAHDDGKEDVRVITLGTSSPYPRPGDPCSSFLLENSPTRLWLDAGAGTLGALLRHCPLPKLDAVWISHTHADHFSDLAVTFYALRYADVHRPPLAVFGPPGWAERLRAFLTHKASQSLLEDVFEVHELRDRRRVTIGNLELEAVRMHHDAPCFGVRVAARGRIMAYTGDTGPCEGLSRLSRDADLLISEAGYGPGPAPSEDEVHLTAAGAGTAAATGRVGKLLLTHLAGADPRECTRLARAMGAASVEAAHPGRRVHV